MSPLAGEHFITPMAAVAGSVADEVLAALVAGRKLDKAYVNNGGDSALSRGRAVDAAGDRGNRQRILPTESSSARMMPCEAWRPAAGAGESFSLGIADAVTVLARTGAEADAAATIIANAVDLPGHPAIRRESARSLAPDSDLGDRLVTTDVGPLSASETSKALESGFAEAEKLQRRGLIEAAALFLNGHVRICGDVLAKTPRLKAFEGELVHG